MSLDGKVIGITTFYLKESQNVNFAIAATGLDLLSYGKDNIDYLSPVAVDRAFFEEISNNNLEAAIPYVFPDEQETFIESFRKEGIPKIPINAQLFGRISGGEKKGLPSAEVGFIGSSLGVDLVLKFNRWWIAK